MSGIQKTHRLGGTNRVQFKATDGNGDLVNVDAGTLAISLYRVDGIALDPPVGTVAQVNDDAGNPVIGMYELTFPSTGLTPDSDVHHTVQADIGGTTRTILIDSDFRADQEAMPKLCG